MPLCKQCNKSLSSDKKKFCNSYCFNEWQKVNRKGENNPNWQGGVWYERDYEMRLERARAYRKTEEYKKVKSKYVKSPKGLISTKKYQNNHKKECHIRSRTYHKYGKLPDNFVYHHIPPYRIDVWIGMDDYEHRIYENRVKQTNAKDN